VETNISKDNFIEGGLLFNLSGELVGIKSIYANADQTDLFAPISDITSAIADYTTKRTGTQ